MHDASPSESFFFIISTHHRIVHDQRENACLLIIEFKELNLNSPTWLECEYNKSVTKF